MNTKFKIELDGSTVRYYYWRKVFWIWGEWIPFINRSYGDINDAHNAYLDSCALNSFLWNPELR